MRPPFGRSAMRRSMTVKLSLVWSRPQVRFDVGTGGMPHRRELAKVTTAWKRAKAQADVKEQTEALQKQHGERITLLPEDWTSIMVQFQAKHGNDLTDDELPAQAYFKLPRERLAAGMLRAEPLDQVIGKAVWCPSRLPVDIADKTQIHEQLSKGR